MRLPREDPILQRVRSWHPHYVRHGRAALGVRIGRLLTAATRKRTETLAQQPFAGTRFVLIARARTGSTLFQGLLDGHPRVVAYGELFTPMIPLTRWFPGARDIELLAPVRLLRHRVWPDGHPPEIAVGFELHDMHARRLAAPVWDYLQAMPSLRVIHLVRRNGLARYVSLVRAQRDRIWAVQAGGQLPDAPAKVSIDPDGLLKALGMVELHEQAIRDFFGGHRFLEIAYEDLVGDRPGQLGRAFTFLGVESMDIAPTTRRIRTRSLADEVANWSDVCQALQGTRWEWMVDDMHAPETSPGPAVGRAAPGDQELLQEHRETEQ